MVNSKPKHREYYEGLLFLPEERVESFKYSIEEDWSADTNKPVRNVLTQTERKVIKTSWDLPFEKNKTIEIDNQRYKIQKCRRTKTERNEIAARRWKNNNIYWIIEVTR